MGYRGVKSLSRTCGDSMSVGGQTVPSSGGKPPAQSPRDSDRAGAILPLATAAVLTIAAVLAAELPLRDFFITPANYLPLHTSLEFVAISVSAMVFGLGWNLRQQTGNASRVILALAFLAVAAIDLVHTLSYMGMPDFVTPSGPEKAINFWLAGRFIAALGLGGLVFPLDRQWPAAACAAALAAAVAIIALVCWAGLYHADLLPRTFIVGQGLTATKVGAEYLLMALYGLTAVLLSRRGEEAWSASRLWLAAGAWTLALAESFFTLYATVTDLFNLLGHVYKAAAYLMVYRALFVEGVRAPFRALDWERAHLKALLTTIPDLVWLKDVEGRYLTCNPMFERFFGAKEDAIVGRTDHDFVDAALADFFRQKDLEALAADRPSVNEEWVTFADDGHRALLETIKTPMRDASGVLIGVLGIARDITARRQTEDSLESANQHLEQFAHVASHDLREPLRTVNSYVALLERRYGGHLDDEGQQFMKYIRDAAQRADRMVLDLLEFSQLARSAEPFVAVPMGEVVEAATAALARPRNEAGAEIAVTTELPVVMGSRVELTRLLQHLIGNAIKYRHPERRPNVTISCRRHPEGWLFAVADNGIGIEAAYFDSIFAIFQRLHTRERYEGNGIGLAICKKVVEHHNGRIWVESVPDQGSTFLFTLPEN